MKAVQIQQRVDEPPHALLWSADELAPMMIGLTFGVLLGQVLICFFTGLLVTRAESLKYEQGSGMSSSRSVLRN
jgi:hypothetical protein